MAGVTNMRSIQARPGVLNFRIQARPAVFN